MSQSLELNRRTFLKSAGVTAVLGAVGAKPASAIETYGVPPTLLYPTYDFDEIYDRVGTDCSKWDSPIATYGEDIEVPMGIADMDFRAAPCITKALAERCAHENWGYLRRPGSYVQSIVDFNKRRYDLDIDAGSIVLNTGVHAGLISALQTFAPPGSRVLMTTPIYSGFYSDLRFTRTVAEESLMNLVDQHDDAVFEADLPHPRHVLRGPQVARGVLRITEDERVAATGPPFEVLEVDRVPPVHKFHEAFLGHRPGESKIAVEPAVDWRGHEYPGSRR